MSDAIGTSGLFDLALANELYGTLLGPVEALVKDKRSLLIVPSGALGEPTVVPARSGRNPYDARSCGAKDGARQVDFRNALIALPPEKQRMLAEEYVARHQAFDGLVGVEESIRAQQEGQACGDGGGGDDHEGRQLARPSKPNA